MNIEPIAYIHTDFDEKFGIPRQSGRVRSLTGRIVFVPEYRKPEALRGIDGFSHLWLLFPVPKEKSGRLPFARRDSEEIRASEFLQAVRRSDPTTSDCLACVLNALKKLPMKAMF